MRFPVLLFCLSLAITSAKAQEPVSLSLRDCISYALSHADTIKNSRISVEVQKAQINQIIAAAYPRISGAGDFTAYLKQLQTFVPGDFIGQPGIFVPVTFTPKFSTNGAITGSQIIFDGGVFIALQARQAVIDAVKLGAELTEENLKHSIQKAYYALVIAHKQYGVLKTSLLTARSALNDVETLYKNGFAEKIELDRSSVQLNNLVADSFRTEALIAVSEQALKYVIGMDIHQPITLTDTSLADYMNTAVSLSEEPAIHENRTEFRLLEKQLELNMYDLKRYRYAAVPTLNAFANAGYNYSTNNFEDIFRNKHLFSSLVGLKLNVPIFSGFQRTNQLREAKLNIERTKNNMHLVRETINFQAAQSRTVLKNALLTLASQQRNLELAQNVLDLARKKYNAGVGSNQDVTIAQTEVLRAQTNYFQSMLDVINAQADLKKALGQFR